jgi:hypothetical protein
LFPATPRNEDPFLDFIRMHRDSVHRISRTNIPADP